ncbi:hypothetical protein PENDEC_c010G02447 [Penicillium decumbens]|uniref:Developmental regulatory protein wetA n=1 Tax=Penicillium decumbens TaxID=69771 RepID=A0A1V6PBX0_PENDC|nr:hypothetical protein PENDEC_c010G02447 [Penicillium decumbens]
MFAQPYNHSFDDLFNQYVNVESSGADGNNDLDQLFSLDSLSSNGGDHSPTGSTVRRESPQPWTKDWSLQDDGPSVDQFAYQDTVHPSAISDLGLNNFEVSSRPAGTNGDITSPSTPPATPRRKAVSKSALITPKSIRHRDPNERRALLRKQSSSPSLMRSSVQHGRMAYSDAWAQRVHSFSLGSSDRLPLSPPPSDVIVQHENMSADTINHTREPTEMPQYDTQLFHQSPAVSMHSPSAGALARHQQQYISHPGSSALTNSSPPPADDIFSSSHSSDPHSISSWQSDAFSSTLSFTPDFQGPESQWWSPMPNKVAQQQQPAYHSTPQQRMHSAGNQNNMMQGGLMIQMDPSFDVSAESSFSSSGMIPSNGQKFMTPYTVPQVQNTSHSPSLSPKATPPKGTKGHRRTHSRKLSEQSMNGPKSARSSTSPRGSNKSVSVSFVNFTANDSDKILGGVAPSGSSKTKARREQEARERRRKLSEAALRAVRKAGGDVDALEAIFC